jgi:hypothetical protein
MESAGFSRCTPIQALTLPVALPGGDVAGQAQTGTGKTLAFLVAVINRLLTRPALADLRTAVNPFFGQALTSDAELIAWLALGNRNIHMHQPLAPFTPVDCGAVDPK